MIRHYLNIVLFVLLLFCFNRCAQVAPLTGGARDTTPPKLLEAIPVNSALNFNSNEIVLHFDEYVQLKDLKNQILISPKLNSEPEITSEGKRIRIRFKKEELLPNTTYRFYFGKSVADMTEGNSVPNFEYVFSTGNYIDSLKVNGIITDAYTNQPISDALAGLYVYSKNTDDSLIYKQSPDYVTRSNESGAFNFGHLPKKTFTVIAFTDKNKNYMYDGESEKIGFYEPELILNSDTAIDLSIFREDPSKTYIKKTFSPYYGLLNVIYNRKSVFKSKTLAEAGSGFVTETEQEKEKDTIAYVYNGIKDSLGLVITDLISKRTDTVKVNLPKLNLHRKKSFIIKSNIQTGILPVNTPLELNFLNPPDTIRSNMSKMKLIYKKDTALKEEPVLFRYRWPLEAILTNTLTEGTDYKLKIDSSAFYDLNERYNDSLVMNFKTESKTDLGKVTLKVLLNKKQGYIVQLINDKGQTAKEIFFTLSLSSSNAVSIDFTDVTPGTYTIKVIFDNNENKKWDTGNYLSHKQPEKVFISSKQLKVLSDWEIEEEISIK